MQIDHSCPTNSPQKYDFHFPWSDCQITLTAAKPLSTGKNTIVLDFPNAKSVFLYLNNEPAVQQEITSAIKYLNSVASDGISLGKDLNSPVTKAYNGSFAFTGEVRSLTIEQEISTISATK